jgi:type I restriction enzyme S subunit
MACTTKHRYDIQAIYDHIEEHDSGELPDAWQYVTLSKLCESFGYGTSSKSKRSGAIPVLRMGNIQSGEIDWTDLVFTSDKSEIEKYSLEPNTVLFNRTNSPELVGKTGIYRGERPAIFAGYLIRIITQRELDPEYLNLCLNTAYAREFCSMTKTDGVSQSNINAKKLGRFEVPYCSIDEQHEVVRRAQTLFKLADRIEKRVEVATKRTDKLTQSILAKAFRGELVPTEAELARSEGRTYETAEEFLSRIKSEQTKSQIQSAGKRRQRRAGT